MTRSFLAYLLPVLLASMACPRENMGTQFGPSVGADAQPGQFFVTSASYQLTADGGAEIAEDSCNFVIGPACPSSIGDHADGQSGDMFFSLKTPTQALSGARLEFAFEGAGLRSADVTTTTETTLFASVGGRKVFARVVKTVFGAAAPLDATELFSLRVGETGPSIPIALGEEFTEVTLPAGTSTLFFDAQVQLTETLAGGEYDVVYAIEISRDPPCKSDTHCPDGEKCVTPDGVCATGDVGAECADAHDCDSGICYSGECSVGAAGDFCAIDLDCGSGLYCVNFHCQVGNEGDYCIDAEQCDFAGAHCPQVFAGYGLCTDGGPSDLCLVDGDCAEELSCSSGACAP